MTKSWWKYAGIRALKTVCQTIVAVIGTSAFLSEVNWLLTSVAGLPEVKEGADE